MAAARPLPKIAFADEGERNRYFHIASELCETLLNEPRDRNRNPKLRFDARRHYITDVECLRRKRSQHPAFVDAKG
jgi:hypothetical protein